MQDCPSLSVFLKVWFGYQIVSMRGLGSSTGLSPSFPPSTVVACFVRVFLKPFPRLVADSLEGHSFTLLLEDFSSVTCIRYGFQLQGLLTKGPSFVQIKTALWKSVHLAI